MPGLDQDVPEAVNPGSALSQRAEGSRQVNGVVPQKFTWRELANLNKRHNAHVAYRGKVSFAAYNTAIRFWMRLCTFIVTFVIISSFTLTNQLAGEREHFRNKINFKLCLRSLFAWIAKLKINFHTPLLPVSQVYDVSSFVSSHPGGVDQIMMGAGRDITQIFESYHKLEIAEWVWEKNNTMHIMSRFWGPGLRICYGDSNLYPMKGSLIFMEIYWVLLTQNNIMVLEFALKSLICNNFTVKFTSLQMWKFSCKYRTSKIDHFFTTQPWKSSLQVSCLNFQGLHWNQSDHFHSHKTNFHGTWYAKTCLSSRSHTAEWWRNIMWVS